MADLSQPLDQILTAQAQKEVTANEIFDAVSPAALYGRRAETSAGLTLGIYGGRFNSTLIAHTTVTLTDNATNYIVQHRTTGAVSISTSITNWNDTTTYGRCLLITLLAGVETVREDHRQSIGGLGVGGAGAPSTVDYLVGTASGGLSAEIVVGTSPGGELGGTWASPTVDATHSGSTHAAVQAAAEATAAAYTDAKVAGLSWKQAARVATTANGALATAFENGDTIDGVTLATGDRILIKNQSAGEENGIYVVAASGAPVRATDADSAAELVNASVYVSEGTTLADTQWTCATNAPITVNTTALVFAQLASGGFTGGTLTSALNEAPAVVIASAGTVNIGAAAGNTISISGTTTITAFDSIADGARRLLYFQDALTFTHNATSLILPTGANITTVAGDTAEALSLGSGNWRITSYQRKDGTALSAAGGSGAWGAITGTITDQVDLMYRMNTIALMSTPFQ